LGLPLITAAIAIVLPLGGSLSSRVLFSLSIPFVLLDDVIMTSLVSLTDVVLASLELLVIVAGVALIGLGGVKCLYNCFSKFN
jgi:hypothetical protein